MDTTVQPRPKPRPNVELLRRTLAHIEAHPDDWYQEDYRCETGMCFAGWAIELTGGRWIADADDGHWCDMVVAEEGEGDLVVDRHPSGVGVVPASARARRLLGLTNAQSSLLFAGGNSLDNLRAIVAEICESAS